MRFLLATIVTAILALAACLYLPWWSIAPVAFVVAALVYQRPWKSFLSGFVALFVAWVSLTWYLNSANEGILARKISMLILKTENATLLILLTGLLGGLVAGLAALSGSFVHKRPVVAEDVS